MRPSLSVQEQLQKNMVNNRRYMLDVVFSGKQLIVQMELLVR